MTLENIWQDFLKIVSEEVGSRVVETWFKAVRFKSWDAIRKEVFLEAPNAFVRDWIHKNYLPLSQQHLGRLLNTNELRINVIDIKAVQSDGQSLLSNTVAVMPAVVTTDISMPFATITRNKTNERSTINSIYTFDTFVVGPHNSLACAAARAVAENPGKLYNPLFIYGASGLGKTHLLHAIGNAIKVEKKSLIVVYQTAARFVTEFINAIRFNKTIAFEEKYQAADVLLIDDIQFISHKEQTQEAFFHIFNTLYDARKQIVFSSDIFPDHMQGIADRLRSRFTWGLITDLHTPSLETKIAILKKKAQANNHELDDQVSYFIASSVASNVRELEGALIRVMAFAALTSQVITIDLVRKVLLRSDQQKNPKIMVDPDMIMKVLSKHYPYGKEALCSSGRNKDLVLVRHIAMFLMKRLTDKSFRDIGLLLGSRDHSTVMHAVEKIKVRVDSEEDFGTMVQRIEQELLSV